MTRILYFGHMKSSFARIDAELLARLYDVQVVDMAKIVWKHTQLPTYFVQFFTAILPGIRKNDIIWMWTADYPLLPVFLAAKLIGRKTVVHLSGYEVHNDPEIEYGIQGSIVRGYIARWIIKHTDVLVTQSEDYVIRVTKLVPEARVMMLPGALTTEYVSAIKENRVITAYCTYKNSFKVKGIATFLAATMYLQNYRCKVIHDKSHREMIAEMRKAKVYCQLSYVEQFGVALLEAMACGCVPVVTDRGALPEIVGNVGVIVPYGDIEATVDGIRKAMMMDGTLAQKRSRDFSVERKLENLKAIVRMVE